MKIYTTRRLLALLVLMAGVTCAWSKDTPTRKIWIDTDIAIGEERPEGGGYADVDDAYALLQMMAAAKLDIVGLSATYGNTTLPQAYRISKKVVRRYAPQRFPVTHGATGPLQLDSLVTNEAVEVLAQNLGEQKLTILALGPATNVATLLLLYPQLAERIEEIVLVAGRRSADYAFHIGDEALPFPDFNFELDPIAFQVIMQTEIPITLCPFEISSQVWIKAPDLEKLAQMGSSGRFLAKLSMNWLENWKSFGSDGFNPFDALASHYLVHPEGVQHKRVQAHVEFHPDDTQPGRFKPYLICNQQPGRTVTYCYAPVPGVKEILLREVGNLK